jgi:hypothetical protein
VARAVTRRGCPSIGFALCRRVTKAREQGRLHPPWGQLAGHAETRSSSRIRLGEQHLPGQSRLQ